MHNNHKTTARQPQDNHKTTARQPQDNHKTTTRQPQDNRKTTTRQPQDNHKTDKRHERSSVLPFFEGLSLSVCILPCHLVSPVCISCLASCLVSAFLKYVRVSFEGTAALYDLNSSIGKDMVVHVRVLHSN